LESFSLFTPPIFIMTDNSTDSHPDREIKIALSCIAGVLGAALLLAVCFLIFIHARLSQFGMTDAEIERWDAMLNTRACCDGQVDYNLNRKEMALLAEIVEAGNLKAQRTEKGELKLAVHQGKGEQLKEGA
jgi:hypothetical protein